MLIKISQPGEAELRRLNVYSWDIWTCDPSRFEWSYSDRETCYILEGKFTVTNREQKISAGPGDLIIFPAGLDCIWDVQEPVRKHYMFG